MKRFITLILMLTILTTFIQKVSAFAPVLNDDIVSIVNCPMPMMEHSTHKDMNKAECTSDGMSQGMDCPNNCDMMTVVSVLHFIDYTHSVNQSMLLLSYQRGTSGVPYYFPESLYRPPFLS